MSTSTADFPDWFVGIQQQNPQLFVEETIAMHTSVPVTFGPFNVAQWANVQLFVTSDHNFFGTVDMDMAGTFANPTAEYDFRSTAGIPYSDVLPVAGAFAQLRVTYMTGVGTATTATRFAPTQNDDAYKRGQGQLYVMAGVAVAVGASSSLTVQPQLVTSGKAMLTVNTNATAWNAKLITVDNTGTTIAIIAFINGSNTGILGPVGLSLPTDQVRLVLTNNDAAGRTFDYGLVLER